MTLNTFFRLVEIQTKLASLFPFLIGTLFSLFFFRSFDPVNTLIFFVAMIVFDMTTTAINNLMDYQKATSEEYRKNHNIIGQAAISEKLVGQIILMMLLLASVLGIVLVFRTNLMLLLIGGICFLIGIFYTFGPVPISRMPLGEPLSGLTMGFGIFFIAVFVNDTEQALLNLTLQGPIFSMSGNLLSILTVFIVSLPQVFLIANIMLANNTCDLEQDIANHRYTLPYYIGRKRAVQLFNVLMYSCYTIIVIAVLLGWLPLVMLLILVTLVPIRKQLQAFNREQIKEKTFVVALKNLVMFSGTEIVLLATGLIITYM